MKPLNKTQLKRVERAVKLSKVSLRNKATDVSKDSKSSSNKLTVVIWRG